MTMSRNDRFISTPFIARTMLSAAAAACAIPLASEASASDDALAETITLTGTVRDFIERSKENGHPDMEKKPDRGFAHYTGNISPTLGEDGKPVYTGLGKKVSSQWRDSTGRQISSLIYNASLGDTAGSATQSSTGGITSEATFDQWFRDVPGTNLSMPLSLTFVLQEDGSYVFDDREDPAYEDLGGFFPIDNQLFGNSGGTPVHNFHFTYELHTVFTYDSSGNQFFKFTGDDDVWVFVNGQLVIDLGGVHGAIDQYLDMSRLGLTDGEDYTLDFFFAERHRTQSNFRIATNLQLADNPAALPSATAAFD